MRTITVVPYQETWPSAFEKIKDELLPVLGEDLISIEHVGSTSVPGLWAKPIIDLNVVIENDRLSQVIEKLASIHYIHEGDLGIAGREAFRYTGKPHLMEHHLYVCPKDCAELKRQIAFRDYLRSNPLDCEEYSRIKVEMARKFPHDIKRYIQGKEPVMMEIYRKCGIEPWK